MALQDLTMMPLSRLDCPLSLKTPNMGNPGYNYRDNKLAVGGFLGVWATRGPSPT